jgi:predicted helicase
MELQTYIDKVSTLYKSGTTTEHSFRGYLQNLLDSLLPEILTTNEPKRVECGAPDYVLTTRNNNIPVGYIEAKDLGADLNSKSYTEQFNRYKGALNNLIITNYLDFQFFKDGILVAEYHLGTITGKTVQAIPDHFQPFTSHINDFALPTGQTIKSASKLAGMMAVKARMLADVIGSALASDEEHEANSTLKDQLQAFKDILIHDIKPNEFADIYAQTIAYGMFAARLHDPTLPTFSRQEAAELIPKTNPFLRRLFQYVAGYDLDSRIVWIVDALADIFRATDVKAIITNFGKATQQNDPIIHFYETFLSEYDPKLRKARGVWYTPEPVVNFIVRAVDDILKTEFNLPQGLADTSKTKIKVKVPTHDKRYTAGVRDYEQEVHKVQILDPATGTGTFLAQVIKHIYSSKFEGQQGIWSNYVENHLIPRLNGFELLMASYAMAHLKLELLLTETGYRPTREQRLRVYLTNSLEESHPDAGTLFANWLSTEANEANQIKRDTPIMVVLGNPPYSISSFNKGQWIEALIEDYKSNLEEQNYNALSDDYVKFIRYAQYFIDKQGAGIVAMITNNSFIDGVTHREMRKSLLKTFNKIYVYDLHGSAKRKEVAPDGTKDENVFDIQQGVSINIFVRTNSTRDFNNEVYHLDSYGRREKKYVDLEHYTIGAIKWEQITPKFPYWFFVPKNDFGESVYNLGFSPKELFIINGNGIEFRKDNLLVKYMYSKHDVLEMLKDINHCEDETMYKKYDFNSTPDWILSEKRTLFIEGDEKNIINIEYRQFDNRFTYYPLDVVNEIIVRGNSRKTLMQNYVCGDNTGLIIGRQGQVVGNMEWNLIYISRYPTDRNIFYRGGAINFPLYIYPQNSNQGILEFNSTSRKPNFDEKVTDHIREKIGLKFTPEKEQTPDTFAPIDVLDYIYAVLHSPAYRERYKEFLKIDFPRVPYPKDATTFWALVALGGQIRQLHLLEAPTVSKYITKYPVDGSNTVTKPVYKDGNVYINDSQYFEGVPLVAWEFYIGGYQPAQKWLKDRKERTLNFEDILHYQKMIVSLTETDRLMKEIDKVDFM